QVGGMRVGNPRRNEGELWRHVTHSAVPLRDVFGCLDNTKLHHSNGRTITECVTRFRCCKSAFLEFQDGH
ncbi:MAG: hypothetical protein M3Z05_16050, partial [Gemmatimonadota bacterium]|nr:hypothetical protein [Gemmatimonadota bacterium]